MSGREWTPTTEEARQWFHDLREAYVDRFTGSYRDPVARSGAWTREEVEAEFDAYVAAHDREVAERAWDEGAETTWQATGEGWNGEYGADMHDPPWSAVASSMPTNPYRKEAGA